MRLDKLKWISSWKDEDFAEKSKNVTKYKSENNFIGPLKYLHKRFKHDEHIILQKNFDSNFYSSNKLECSTIHNYFDGLARIFSYFSKTFLCNLYFINLKSQYAFH